MCCSLQVFQTLEYSVEIDRKTQLKQLLTDGRVNFTRAVLNSPYNVSFHVFLAFMGFGSIPQIIGDLNPKQ